MSDLTRPLTLRCGLTLPHRAALAPLTNTQSHDDGTLGDDEFRWLLARAHGGFGLLSTCAAYVSDEGKAWRGQLGIADASHDPGLARLAAALTDAGAIPVVQLHHAGRIASLAPGLKLGPADGEGVRAATADDLARVVDTFVAAARRAVAAGFAGVEVHGANGYLFTQFLAPADNPREDAWGGDLAGRARLLRDTVRAVRAAVPAGFAVGVRLSPVDVWSQRGLVVDDGAQVAAWLADDGADWIHLSLGSAWGTPPTAPGDEPVARTVRRAVRPDVPILAAGGIGTAGDVARAFDAGVDVVVIGRAAIAHPDWPRRVLEAGFTVAPTPWSEASLREAAVGDAFLTYLKGFPGLVEGGRAAR